MKIKEIFLNFSLLIFLGVFFVFAFSFAEKFLQEKKEKEKVLKNSLRVEILNGTEISKLAQKVTAELREMGFDVVYFGNSPKPMSHTVIFDRTELRGGKILAKEIKCDRVYFEPDMDRLVDITLILGKDYKKYFPDLEEEWE